MTLLLGALDMEMRWYDIWHVWSHGDAFVWCHMTSTNHIWSHGDGFSFLAFIPIRRLTPPIILLPWRRNWTTRTLPLNPVTLSPAVSAHSTTALSTWLFNSLSLTSLTHSDKYWPMLFRWSTHTSLMLENEIHVVSPNWISDKFDDSTSDQICRLDWIMKSDGDHHRNHHFWS